jgi:hypothetical protein
MSHARALRVIGQTLEASQVSVFKLEKSEDCYRLWIAKDLFCFDEAEILRVDAQAQKRRAKQLTFPRPPSSLSQQIRALGDHFDRIQVRYFRLVWTSDCVIVEYQRFDEDRNAKVFTAEELRQLGLNRSLLRSPGSNSRSLNPLPVGLEEGDYQRRTSKIGE